LVAAFTTSAREAVKGDDCMHYALHEWNLMVVACAVLRCQGGEPEAAWQYYSEAGLVTGGNYDSHQVKLLVHSDCKSFRLLRFFCLTVFSSQRVNTVKMILSDNNKTMRIICIVTL